MRTDKLPTVCWNGFETFDLLDAPGFSGANKQIEENRMTKRKYTEKLEAVEAVIPPELRRGRFKAPDALIASLLSDLETPA